MCLRSQSHQVVELAHVLSNTTNPKANCNSECQRIHLSPWAVPSTSNLLKWGMGCVGRGDLGGKGVGTIGGPDNKDAGPCFRLSMSDVTSYLTGMRNHWRVFKIWTSYIKELYFRKISVTMIFKFIVCFLFLQCLSILHQ